MKDFSLLLTHICSLKLDLMKNLFLLTSQMKVFYLVWIRQSVFKWNIWANPLVQTLQMIYNRE